MAKMRFIYSLNLLFLIFSFLPGNAQNTGTSLNSDAKIKSTEIPFERVYLHLDRTVYYINEDIWFKAYLLNATNGVFSKNSTILYAELISPDLKIIKRMMLKITNGTGAGDIHLDDTLHPGIYQMRAYTSWMKNFGDLFFFDKEIQIENEDKSPERLINSNSHTDKKVDVQFFPEGGSLIDNVYSVIGFKGINTNGLGCTIKGEIITSEGDSIIDIESTHLGMGRFILRPKKDIKYFAVGNAGNSIPFRVELPSAFEIGYSIKVTDINKDYFRVSVKTNQETLDKNKIKSLLVLGTSHNMLCVLAKVKAGNIENPVNLPKMEFPEGVALITLMDTTGYSFCQRAFYIHHESDYDIDITADKEVYSPRQKIILKISTTDSINNPLPSALSISVTDGNQIKNSEHIGNIVSYLLLESEIRGHIEQPYFYFDENEPYHFQALDNLLLTQGWRSFVWNYLSDTTIRYKYPIERGIRVSGNLRHKWTNTPIRNANISLAILKPGGSEYKFTQTDSIGRYCFDGCDFTGLTNLLIYAADDKGLREGILKLDSINQDTDAIFAVNTAYRGYYQKVNDSLNIHEFINVQEPEKVANSLTKARQKNEILKKYRLSDTIRLHEVPITANKLIKENSDGHFRLYGVPDFSLTVSDNLLTYPNAIQSLQGRVSGLYITGDSHTGYRFIMRGQVGTPLFLLDGKEVDEKSIMGLPMSAIDKIEVIKEGGKLALYGMRASFGAISVFTKRGINGAYPPKLNFLNVHVYGYYQTRRFYSPKYDAPDKNNEKTDLRATIYWDPYIVTNNKGNVTISFYSSDARAPLNVDIEGIINNRYPIVAHKTLMVK